MRPTGWQSIRSVRMRVKQIFEINKNDFVRSTNFKLLSHVKGNSIQNRNFLKLMISLRGGYCDYSPPREKY